MVNQIFILLFRFFVIKGATLATKHALDLLQGDFFKIHCWILIVASFQLPQNFYFNKCNYKRNPVFWYGMLFFWFELLT